MDELTAPSGPQAGQPGQDRRDRDQRPAGQRQPPSEGVPQGNGDVRRQRGPDSDHDHVEAGHRADMAGEVALDRRRQEHVAHRHPRQRDRAQHQERYDAVDHRAPERAGHGHHQAEYQRALQAELAPDGRGQRADHGEAQGRQQAEYPDRRGADAEILAQVLDQRRDRRHRRAQGQGDERDPDQHQQLHSASPARHTPESMSRGAEPS